MTAPLPLLLVDDEPVNLALLEGLARAAVRRRWPEWPVTCDRAADGAEALRLLAERRYAAMLLDLMMPGVDGFAVLAELRRRGDRTPVVVVTAIDRSLIARVPVQQVVAILPKPIDAEQLRATLLAAIEQGPFRPRPSPAGQPGRS